MCHRLCPCVCHKEREKDDERQANHADSEKKEYVDEDKIKEKRKEMKDKNTDPIKLETVIKIIDYPYK